MTLYIMPSGKFPMQNGGPVGITREEFEDCCCDAPCTCPCYPWLPDEWPCGGLLEEYLVDNGAVSTIDGAAIYGTVYDNDTDFSEYRFSSSFTVTASEAESCTWRAADVCYQRRSK
jgi:hypothetical protein